MDDIEKDDPFIKENPVLFKKFRVKKKLGEGAFGDVYMGSTVEKNELIAIKVEQRKILKPLLESEAFYLYSLKGLGIPEVLSFGRHKNYNILIEPLLGKSLFEIFAQRRKKLPLEDICLISMQIIERIQWVHSKNIVHRDIKPDNFLIGRKDPNIIYLIDFGLSKKYKSSTTGKHIRFGFTGKLTGTVRFGSANALRGGEQSRRDDLESIGYMIIYFMRGKLPWQGVTGNKKMEKYLKIYKMKKNISPEDLCRFLPKQMTQYIRYVKQLEFEQEPDYNYLRSLFKSLLKIINGTNDQLLFSWIKLSDLPNLKNPVNPSLRRDSPQNRLYRKIQQSLDKDKKRNISSDNDSGQNSHQTFTSLEHNIEIVKNYSKDIDIVTNTHNLKIKEGLNTTVTNLNKTIDEKLISDFEKPSSNDICEVTIPGYSHEKNNMNENKEGNMEGKPDFSTNKNNQNIKEIKEEKKEKTDGNEKKQIKQTEQEIKNKIGRNKNLIQNTEDNNNQINRKNNSINIINYLSDKNLLIISDNLGNSKTENIQKNENNIDINDKPNILHKNINNINEISNDIINNKNDNNQNIVNEINIESKDEKKNDSKNLLESHDNKQNNIKISNNRFEDNRELEIKKTISTKIKTFIDNIKLSNEEKNKGAMLTEKKEYKNNDIYIKQFNNINNNNLQKKLLKLDNQPRNEKNKQQKNEINLNKEYLNNNNNKKEEPSDNNRNKKIKKNNKTMKTEMKEENNLNIKGNYISSKNINNNLEDSIKKIKIKNISNGNSNIKLNGRKIQINLKNNKTKITKINTECNINHSNINNNGFLPKNSDEIEKKCMKDFEPIKKNNEDKIISIKKLNNNIKVKEININSNHNQIRKNIRNNNNLQKIRVNSNNKSSDKNQNNKTVPNFNFNSLNSNDLNTNNNKEIKNNINVKKLIINRTKNLKNPNYSNNEKNSITISNNNYLNLIPNDNVEFMASNKNNIYRNQESYSNDKINKRRNNAKNNINMNMNINNNINNLVINNARNNDLYQKQNIDKNNNIISNYQEPLGYIPHKRGSHNVKNNMNAFNVLNKLEIHKRPSDNRQSKNLAYFYQMGMDKKPSCNTNNNKHNYPNYINMNNAPLNSGYTTVNKLNNNNMNREQQNFDINNNIYGGQINPSYLYTNNLIGEKKLINNNLMNTFNRISPTIDLIPYEAEQNINSNRIENINNMNIHNNLIFANDNFYSTNNNIQLNTNVSSDVKDKNNILLEQFPNTYGKYENKLDNIQLYKNNNNTNLYNFGNYFS